MLCLNVELFDVARFQALNMLKTPLDQVASKDQQLFVIWKNLCSTNVTLCTSKRLYL